jgi:hypothetical protein
VAVVAIGLPVADPLIGLAITAVILRIHGSRGGPCAGMTTTAPTRERFAYDDAPREPLLVFVMSTVMGGSLRRGRASLSPAATGAAHAGPAMRCVTAVTLGKRRSAGVRIGQCVPARLSGSAGAVDAAEPVARSRSSDAAIVDRAAGCRHRRLGGGRRRTGVVLQTPAHPSPSRRCLCRRGRPLA